MRSGEAVDGERQRAGEGGAGGRDGDCIRIARCGLRGLKAIEGLKNAEWVLMDYGDLVVHIFSEAAREYYDLGRLYRDAQRLQAPV